MPVMPSHTGCARPSGLAQTGAINIAEERGIVPSRTCPYMSTCVPHPLMYVCTCDAATQCPNVLLDENDLIGRYILHRISGAPWTREEFGWYLGKVRIKLSEKAKRENCDLSTPTCTSTTVLC